MLRKLGNCYPKILMLFVNLKIKLHKNILPKDFKAKHKTFRMKPIAFPLQMGGKQLCASPHDEQLPDVPWLIAQIIPLLSKLPLHDERSASLNELEQAVDRVRPYLHIGHNWQNATSDRTLEQLATQGICCQYLTKTSNGFEIDLSLLMHIPVRDPYQPYGAKASFNEQLKLLSIETHKGVYKPGDSGWEDAKAIFRITSLVHVTIVDHLIYAHFQIANVFSLAQDVLPGSHPLYRLILPFLYGSTSINQEALSELISKNAIAYRNFSFTWSGIDAAFNAVPKILHLETFPNKVARQKTNELGQKYPFAEDGLAFWEVIHNFVSGYVSAYALDPTGNNAIVEWLETIHKHSALESEVLHPTNEAELTDLLTTFIFTVTGYHRHIGSLDSEYISNPEFVTPCIMKGEKIIGKSPLAALQIGLLLSIGTDLPSTQLYDADGSSDFSQIMLDDKGRQLVKGLQKDLAALEKIIESRNREREIPLTSFQPTRVPISIQT